MESGTSRGERHRAGTVEGLRAAFGLNTRLFLNTFDGVSDEEAGRRPNERTNSMAFIAAHLVDVRHHTLGYLGVRPANPLEASLRDASGIDEVADLPDLDTLRGYWREVSTALEDRIATLDEGALAGASSQAFPIDDDTVLGGIQFLLHHEAYHIGQLAMLRKFHGHPAMAFGGA